jgi:signal transduction histidine kinase
LFTADLCFISLTKFGPDAVGVFRVEVSDSGVGLTEDEQRNIFGEFTQFNKNELQGGGNVHVFAF